MSASIQLKLKPWVVPRFATVEMPPRPRQDDIRELPSIPVSDLSREALRSLAEQWLTDLYAKAGQEPDWSFVPACVEAKP